MIFRVLEIDSRAWGGLEETAGSSPAKNHLGAVSLFIYWIFLFHDLDDLDFYSQLITCDCSCGRV